MGWDMQDRCAGAPDRATEIQIALTRYLNAAEGDAHSALRIVVADLLDLSEEAEFRKQALDRWTSLGYLRGRASSILAMQGGKSIFRRGGSGPSSAMRRQQ